MLNFIIWCIRFYRARHYRNFMVNNPYYWGESIDDPKGYERHNAIRMMLGEQDGK